MSSDSKKLLWRLTWTVCAIFIGIECRPYKSKKESSFTCGYKSCPLVVDDAINVHLVPHTHDDVGWIKTFEEYYQEDVKRILQSVVTELIKNKQRRFIYVEVAFLKRWWIDQDYHMKNIVRRLVNQGRLEFVLGGWSMNDEATTHYVDIIDQHTLGSEFLRKEFGECGIPLVAWQIDTFGHSEEQASLFAQMGLDGLFLGRIHFEDKNERENNRSMEFFWKLGRTFGNKGGIFTGVLPNKYEPPDGFCFDVTCGDLPLKYIPNPELMKRLADFVYQVKQQANHYATNQLIMTMGSDFQYKGADAWYDNLDILIREVNKLDIGINLLYSTPSCYLNQLYKSNTTWTTSSGDFFPYAHRHNSYWTGFYTSRPAFKRLVRKASSLLQVCKQLSAFNLVESTYEDIQTLREAMGIVQHHDAITGTSQERVSEDYTIMIEDGIKTCKNVIERSIGSLLPRDGAIPKIPTYDTTTDNDIDLTSYEDNNLTVIVYNSLSWERQIWIRLLVCNATYGVFGPNEQEVVTEIVPVSQGFHNTSLTRQIQVFSLKIPPLGFTTYFMHKMLNCAKQPLSQVSDRTWYKIYNEGQPPGCSYALKEGNTAGLTEEYIEDVVIENKFIRLTFNQKTGLLTDIENREKQIHIRCKQQYMYYTSESRLRNTGQSSGAYVFLPHDTTPLPVSQQVQLKIYKGKLVQEVHQTFTDWMKQVIRLWQNKYYVEIEWLVGPIPSGGLETISRFDSDLQTDGLFFTDANGRHITTRRRNCNLSECTEEAVSSNYYPVTTLMYIKDVQKNIQLTLLTDRSEGGSSLKDGSIEFMIHRRLLNDDQLGVEEILNDSSAVRGKHYLILDSPEFSARKYRKLAKEIYSEVPVLLSTTKDLPISVYAANYHTMRQNVEKFLPPNIHLLSFERMKNHAAKSYRPVFLMRVEHIFEQEEDEDLSKHVDIDFNDIFRNLEIVSAHELTLSANRYISEKQRFDWKYFDQNIEDTSDHDQFSTPLNVSCVRLTPMSIRTFAITLEIKH